VVRSAQEYVGGYRLLNLVMSGQTSQVWEAVNDAKQQRVAIKMLLRDFRKDREHIAYLKNEYAVGVKLNHPRVIRIYELGTHDGSPYLAMEYFPFPNLKQYLNKGADRLAYFVPKIIQQAGEGLDYFNEQGWIHRDVKPDNFLMNYDGDVKLIDFALAQKKKTGLARLFGGGGKVQGTRSYMSPEQIRAQVLDQRADVYSFGCVVHELVGGKPPFTGSSSNDLLAKHLKSPPPRLDAINNNVQAGFAELILRTLSKNPDKRPESVGQFLQEFRSLRVYKIPPKTPGEPPAAET